jgi:hypothetical protein
VTERRDHAPACNTGEVMPIRSFLRPDSAFDAEATRIMGVAFDAACRSLLGQPDLVKEIIAQKIIEAASKGERDPTVLLNVALEALNGSNERQYG